MIDQLAIRICTTNWCRLPVPLWALIACPLLHWAGIRRPDGRLFAFPIGRSLNPLHRSFWKG